MKTRVGVMILAVLIGLILGAMQPAMLFAGETPGGDIWDPLIDPKPYPGIWLVGPLSIYYEYVYGDEGTLLTCEETGDPVAMMFVTVRLNKVLDIFRPNPKLWTFQYTNGVCLNDWDGQGTEIKNFLGTVVVPGIFLDFNPPKSSWKLMGISKAQYHDDDISRAFVSDIAIAVKK